MRHFAALRLFFLVLMLAVMLPQVLPASLARSQVAEGATLTVLRVQVAVLRPDGSAIQPAASGTTVFVGDEIRTLNNTGALITFFVGTEIEMGEDTILVVDRVSRQGDRIDVSLKQAFGSAVHRVATFSDPGSSYRVDAGGAVALVRGTEFFVLVNPPIVVLVVKEGLVLFNGVLLGPGAYAVEIQGGRVVAGPEPFAVSSLDFNGAFEAETGARREFLDENKGDLTQEQRANRERAERDPDEDKDNDNLPLPVGLIATLTPTATGTTTPAATPTR